VIWKINFFCTKLWKKYRLWSLQDYFFLFLSSFPFSGSSDLVWWLVDYNIKYFSENSFLLLNFKLHFCFVVLKFISNTIFFLFSVSIHFRWFVERWSRWTSIPGSLEFLTAESADQFEGWNGKVLLSTIVLYAVVSAC
jgi:hypothetical protein